MTPAFTIQRIEGAGDTYTGVTRGQYPDGTDWHIVTIGEIRDGGVWRAVTYIRARLRAAGVADGVGRARLTSSDVPGRPR